MTDDDLAASLIGLLRRFWDLSDVTDMALLPHAHRIVQAVRLGMSNDALVSDLTDLLFVRLVKPIGDRAQLQRLAALMREMVNAAPR